MADRSLGVMESNIDEPVAALGGTGGTTLHPDVTKWRVSEVLQWLESRGLGQFKGQFRDNDVTGKVLLKLSSATLTDELGVSSPSDRVVLDEVAALERNMVNVDGWSEAQVARWIEGLELDMHEHVSMFKYHNVDGALLLQLTEQDLIDDLKITKLGQRALLLEEIARLRKRATVSAGRKRAGGQGQAGHGASAADLERLEAQRLQRLKQELDSMKRKVAQMRDAEARAKLRARQAEVEAGTIEGQLKSLEAKLNSRQEAKAATPSAAAAKKAVVKTFVDHCTFKPKLNKKSLELVPNKEGNSFLDRLDNDAKAKQRKMKELVKKQEAKDADPKTEQQERKKCMEFFKNELGWDLSGGVKPEDIERVLDDPGRYNLTLSEKNKRKIRSLRGYEQFLTLFNQFRIRNFVERQKADLDQRAQANASAKAKAEAEKELIKRAEDYFMDRFRWGKVEECRIDELLDNAHAYELVLADEQRAAIAKLRGTAKTRALFKALQTHAFLTRTVQDVQRREAAVKQQQWALAAGGGMGLGAQGARDPNAVQRFLDRYQQDLSGRQERKIKLVEKIQQTDPSFRECTFRPNLSGGKAVKKSEDDE
jgi:hypothetical protein